LAPNNRSRLLRQHRHGRGLQRNNGRHNAHNTRPTCSASVHFTAFLFASISIVIALVLKLIFVAVSHAS